MFLIPTRLNEVWKISAGSLKTMHQQVEVNYQIALVVFENKLGELTYHCLVLWKFEESSVGFLIYTRKLVEIIVVYDLF